MPNLGRLDKGLKEKPAAQEFFFEVIKFDLCLETFTLTLSYEVKYRLGPGLLMVGILM
jgi:hypothetical protein